MSTDRTGIDREGAPADDQSAAGNASEQPEPDQPASSGDKAPDDSSESRPTKLAPIPQGGTSAPTDHGRVFGQHTQSGGQPPSTPPSDGRMDGRRDSDRQPDEDKLRSLQRRGRLAMLFAVGGIFLAILLFPVGTFFGMLVSLAGFVLGIAAWRAGRKAQVKVPGTMAAIVIGAITILFVVASGIVAAVYWQEIDRYMRCMEGAITNSATERCYNEFRQDLAERGIQVPESP